MPPHFMLSPQDGNNGLDYQEFARLWATIKGEKEVSRGVRRKDIYRYTDTGLQCLSSMRKIRGSYQSNSMLTPTLQNLIQSFNICQLSSVEYVVNQEETNYVLRS